MDKLFDIQFLEDTLTYLSSIDKKHSAKIIYNIRKAQYERDADLFKKLTDDI